MALIFNFKKLNNKKNILHKTKIGIYEPPSELSYHINFF